MERRHRDRHEFVRFSARLLDLTLNKENDIITKRARLQFRTILHAAANESLCIAECQNRKTGHTEYVLCAHYIHRGAQHYTPLAKLFRGDPNNEITAPGMAADKLI